MGHGRPKDISLVLLRFALSVSNDDDDDETVSEMDRKLLRFTSFVWCRQVRRKMNECRHCDDWVWERREKQKKLFRVMRSEIWWFFGRANPTNVDECWSLKIRVENFIFFETILTSVGFWSIKRFLL